MLIILAKILMIIFGLFGSLLIIISASIWFGADNDDARGLYLLPALGGIPLLLLSLAMYFLS